MSPRRLLPLALVLMLLGFSAVALARAGGGQSYSGGSSSSSSSSSSSRSYSGSSSYRSSGGGSGEWSCGSICLMATFILVFGLVKMNEGRASRNTSRTINDLSSQLRASRTQSDEQIRTALARITERDPGFQQEGFLLHAEKAFVEIQLAWSGRDFGVARRFMSDGVLKRFTVQLALDELHGKRNATSGVRVLAKRIVGVETDDEFDTLHVELRASLRDTYVAADLPDAEAASRAARAPETTFTEYWSFVRRTTPATGAKGGKLAEGKCPSCGAPVEQAPTATCEFCGAILNSGTFDWVLSEITQEGELRGTGSPVGGFARLKALDPAISRQVLEDRASLVFWKWIEALATGQPKRFARHCTPQTFAHLQGIEGKPSNGLSQTAVGSVDLLFVDSDAEYDRAWFLFRWSTAGAGAGIVRSTVMQVARKAGLKTNAKAGFATDRCHNCAAFQTGLDAVECSHCGAVLSQDWAFVEMVSPEAFQLQRQAAKQEIAGLSERIGGIADPWERRRALTMMVAAARANGVVTSKEQKLLRTCAERWSIEQTQLKALLGAPLEQLTDVQPKSADEARVLFRALVAAALVDGRIDAQEKKLLETMAHHLKLQSSETAAIVNELSRGTARPEA